MEQSSSSRNETNLHRFDSYCKKILKNEAIDCYREIQKHRQREVVLMSYYLDMSDTEIARHLNLRQSTIHYHRTSSLKTLKQYLEAKADEEM